jgi:hypothetical protein
MCINVPSCQWLWWSVDTILYHRHVTCLNDASLSLLSIIMASRNTKATVTPATRSSSRAKVPADRPQTARTTRAASKTKDTTHVADPMATPARKPLWNRDNALATPMGTVKKPVAPKTKLQGPKVRKDTEDVELEAIKVFHGSLQMRGVLTRSGYRRSFVSDHRALRNPLRPHTYLPCRVQQCK